MAVDLGALLLLVYRYLGLNEDMIQTTGLAAAAVAYRNAVLRVIPRAITDHVYKAAQNKITGDLTDEQKLLKARTEWIKIYKSTYEATDEEILTLCGVKAVTGIKQEQIATLMGVDQAIKDGDTTVEEALGRTDGENKDGEKVRKDGEDFENDGPAGKDTPAGNKENKLQFNK
ncbi:MAG: hypothetical protein GH155_01160 [Spirochaeta sp.]|nr:hypothetical protein [Spirochaeta sp.]